MARLPEKGVGIGNIEVVLHVGTKFSKPRLERVDMKFKEPSSKHVGTKFSKPRLERVGMKEPSSKRVGTKFSKPRLERVGMKERSREHRNGGRRCSPTNGACRTWQGKSGVRSGRLNGAACAWTMLIVDGRRNGAACGRW